jgi:hypothetical protein
VEGRERRRSDERHRSTILNLGEVRQTNLQVASANNLSVRHQQDEYFIKCIPFVCPSVLSAPSASVEHRQRIVVCELGVFNLSFRR